jgi:hypothetical protein
MPGLVGRLYEFVPFTDADAILLLLETKRWDSEPLRARCPDLRYPTAKAATNHRFQRPSSNAAHNRSVQLTTSDLSSFLGLSLVFIRDRYANIIFFLS